MDKLGHSFTAYFESRWVYAGARWAGIPRKKAIWWGVGLGTLFQGSIEILDAFSEEWGFSVPDIAFNTIGVSLFAVQEWTWQEQRIVLKVSSNPEQSYPEAEVPSTEGGQTYPLSERVDELYGGNYFATFLKDYNAMTIWASFNVASFTRGQKADWIPSWLNIAVGHGADNLYGGFDNSWEDDDGVEYELRGDQFSRRRQFYLSLDADLTRIPTEKRWLRSILGLLNIIKIPAPTLELNTAGRFRFHPIYF